jgi:photosystem I P700 chlorophyll a apoprotein A2
VTRFWVATGEKSENEQQQSKPHFFREENFLKAMATKFPKFSQDLAQDPTTRRIWYGIATAHDFETHDGMTEENLYQKIFASHFGHLAIIFLWTSGTLFHVAWQGNFEQWIKDPLNVSPIAHAIWDPQFGKPAVDAFTQAGASYPVDISYSGVYHWFYTIGMTNNQDLYQGAVFLLILASLFLFAGWLHLQPKFRPSLSWFKNAESRMNHHLAGLFGVSSLAWTGHLVHVAIPEARGQHVGWDNFLSVKPHPAGLAPFFTGNWGVYAQNPDTANHVFGTSEGAGTAILTFLGGFHPQTQSLWLTDIAHHHLAIAVIFIIAGHMYRTNWGIGHSMKEILNAHKGPLTGEGHKGLYDTINNSLHFQLGLALASLGVVTSLVAQHMYSMPPYAFLAKDYTTMAALYTHHQYIAGFLMVGAFAHGAIFFVRDYDPEANKNNVLARMLEHKEALISHLSWVSLFLGFHTLGLYVHNDVVVAFGTPEKQILIEPVFAQFIQATSGKALYGFDVLLSNANSMATNTGAAYLPGWLNAINSGDNSLFLTIGPGDFLVHHAIALGLHTTTLILVKGALDARGSKLMPDKKDFGFAFPCDGPGRGGTCDISAWDAFYLAMFWMLNTLGWLTFYWHWKHLCVWQGNVAQFNENSTYLMGWFRDYLWANSAQLINGYNPYGVNNLSVWAWMFLLGHLVWATGFMFLISWRGYWQELIETIVWAHERTPLANLVRWKDKPVALSIVQARVVGLAHFTVGYILTYAAFLIASTAGKFG